MTNDKHSTFCVNCENYISDACMSCKTKSNGVPCKYVEIGTIPKKSNFDIIKAMSIEQLAEWLDENGMWDYSPWSTWWDQKYCQNCESVICKSEDAVKVVGPRLCFSDGDVECAYCEIYDKCRFFPEHEDVPDSSEIIRMWLEAEVE